MTANRRRRTAHEQKNARHSLRRASLVTRHLATAYYARPTSSRFRHLVRRPCRLPQSLASSRQAARRRQLVQRPASRPCRRRAPGLTWGKHPTDRQDCQIRDFPGLGKVGGKLFRLVRVCRFYRLGGSASAGSVPTGRFAQRETEKCHDAFPFPPFRMPERRSCDLPGRVAGSQQRLHDLFWADQFVSDHAVGAVADEPRAARVGQGVAAAVRDRAARYSDDQRDQSRPQAAAPDRSRSTAC